MPTFPNPCRKHSRCSRRSCRSTLNPSTSCQSNDRGILDFLANLTDSDYSSAQARNSRTPSEFALQNGAAGQEVVSQAAKCKSRQPAMLPYGGNHEEIPVSLASPRGALGVGLV